MGLRILEHLDSVLQLAMGDIGRVERSAQVLVDPSAFGQRPQRAAGGRIAQAGFAAAQDQLLGLGQELVQRRQPPAPILMSWPGTVSPPWPLCLRIA